MISYDTFPRFSFISYESRCRDVCQNRCHNGAGSGFGISGGGCGGNGGGHSTVNGFRGYVDVIVLVVLLRLMLLLSLLVVVVVVLVVLLLLLVVVGAVVGVVGVEVVEVVAVVAVAAQLLEVLFICLRKACVFKCEFEGPERASEYGGTGSRNIIKFGEILNVIIHTPVIDFFLFFFSGIPSIQPHSKPYYTHWGPPFQPLQRDQFIATVLRK